MVSTFQRDQSLFRIITEHDFNMRHLQSLAVGLTSDWTFTGLPGTPGAPWSSQPLNPHWAHGPAAWPAAATHDAAPTIYDPAVVATSAFAGALDREPRRRTLSARRNHLSRRPRSRGASRRGGRTGSATGGERPADPRRGVANSRRSGPPSPRSLIDERGKIAAELAACRALPSRWQNYFRGDVATFPARMAVGLVARGKAERVNIAPIDAPLPEGAVFATRPPGQPPASRRAGADEDDLDIA